MKLSFHLTSLSSHFSEHPITKMKLSSIKKSFPHLFSISDPFFFFKSEIQMPSLSHLIINSPSYST